MYTNLFLFFSVITPTTLLLSLLFDFEQVIKYKTLQLVAELIVYVELPLVLHSPSTLLMWPASLARIQTNNDHGNTQLIYKQSVVDSGFPEMIHFIGKEKCNGKIQAGTVPGRTTVYVFNQQQDQSLSINIEIKEISQLLIQGDTNLYVDEEQELGKKKERKD